MSIDPNEPLGDDEWREDPNGPKTVDEHLDAMGKDLRKLTRSSLIATAGVALLLVLVEGSQGNGFAITTGFLVGGGLATINLWILAGGWFAVVDKRATLARVLLATVGSLTVLLGTALWILMAKREWALGFGIGLAVPALGGIIYALQNKSPNEK